MSPSAVRAAAEYVLAPSGEGRGLLPAQAQPRSSDTDGEAAARTLGSPPTSSRAARDRKDAQGSGRASRTVVRSQTPTRTRTASSTGRQPRRRALSRPEVTDGGREPFFNSTYIEIEVNLGKYLPGRRRGGRTLGGGLKTPSASAPHPEFRIGSRGSRAVRGEGTCRARRTLDTVCPAHSAAGVTQVSTSCADLRSTRFRPTTSSPYAFRTVHLLPRAYARARYASEYSDRTDQDSRSSCSPCGGVRRCAIAAASCRCGTFSLRRMCETCTLAVFVLITSAAAISRLV